MRLGRFPRLLVTLSLTAFALAGCIRDEAPDTDPIVDDPEPIILDDALAALQAGQPAANIAELGRWESSGNGELDAWGDYLFVMKNPDLVIMNVSDPADMQEVGRITLPGVKDVKVTHDGMYAFVGQDGTTDAPTGPTRTAGFYVVDVSDKTNPTLASYLEVGPRRGPHMVFYHETADGRELVMGANADISINEFDRDTGTLTELARYSPDMVTDWNRDPGVFDVLYQGWAHDMFVMEDPVLNTTMMYVANWDAGLRIVDLSDPANPREVGKWMDFPEGHAGNLHTVSTMWINETRITVGSPEVGFAVVGGYHYARGDEWTGLYVWDTTDPANIRLLGLWSNPIKPVAERGADPPFAAQGEGVTSSHNVQLEDGRVYMAHYDYGLWMIDVSTPEMQDAPSTLGYFMEDGMSTWDVIVHKGTSYLGDGKAVFALQFAMDTPGPDGLTSRA